MKKIDKIALALIVSFFVLLTPIFMHFSLAMKQWKEAENQTTCLERDGRVEVQGQIFYCREKDGKITRIYGGK